MSEAEYIPTPSQTVGPYFRIGLTWKQSKSCLVAPEAEGDRIVMKFRIFDGDGTPIDDAMLELWQADAHGNYNHPDDPKYDPNCPGIGTSCHGFGRMGTEDEGRCEFQTVKPGRVAGAGGVLQAPHLNLGIFARGMLKQFYTRVYFAGDPANAEDPALALVPEDRRSTLMAQRDAGNPQVWTFDIHMQGERETVFFDI
jgi:protocatechuate 3,4-dioxygenase, alpha subunit